MVTRYWFVEIFMFSLSATIGKYSYDWYVATLIMGSDGDCVEPRQKV